MTEFETAGPEKRPKAVSGGAGLRKALKTLTPAACQRGARSECRAGAAAATPSKRLKGFIVRGSPCHVPLEPWPDHKAAQGGVGDL